MGLNQSCTALTEFVADSPSGCDAFATSLLAAMSWRACISLNSRHASPGTPADNAFRGGRTRVSGMRLHGTTIPDPTCRHNHTGCGRLSDLVAEILHSVGIASRGSTKCAKDAILHIVSLIMMAPLILW